MTVSTTTNKMAYIGNGFATSFAIPFPFLESKHLKVYQLLNDIQTERTDWTISGGNMVFETAPAKNAQIVIIREVPLTQETDYRENEVLPAETLERNFDRLTMQVQQLKEQADRAVTVDIFDDTDAASLIPSIRQSISDAAIYAQTAIEQAANASQASQTAIDQASVAANKAQEATDTLADKASVDLDNLSLNGKSKIVEMSLPGETKISNIFTSPVTTTVQSYVAPANGFVQVGVCIQNSHLTMYNTNTSEDSLVGNTNGLDYGTAIVHVRKNDVVNICSYGSNAEVFHSEFLYAQGEV